VGQSADLPFSGGAMLHENNDELAETYAAQSEAALRAGWDEPAMDDYDHYDEARKKLCP
jgi:hypothetical protein